MNLREFAEFLGVATPTVHGYVHNGLLGSGAKKVGTRWQIDPNLAKENLDRNQSGSRAQRPRGSYTEKAPARNLGEMTLPEARVLNERLKAALKQIELEKVRGAIVSRDQVEREAFSMYRRTRDALLLIPARASAELAALSSIVEIDRVLSEHIKVVLNDLANETEAVIRKISSD